MGEGGGAGRLERSSTASNEGEAVLLSTSRVWQFGNAHVAGNKLWLHAFPSSWLRLTLWLDHPAHCPRSDTHHLPLLSDPAYPPDTAHTHAKTARKSQACAMSTLIRKYFFVYETVSAV